MLSRDVLGEPRLYADYAIAILTTNADGLAHIGVPKVFELADVVGDHAGQGDIQQGVQPGIRPFDDISPECVKRGGARRSCIDRRRHAVPDIGDVRVDSVVRHPPEVVHVKVDQPRRDDESRSVEDLC